VVDGRRATRQQKQAKTRADLLAAARRVFARRGYHAASVEEIAEEAGYSHGAVYSNFASKEDLFLALSEEYALERVRETAQPLYQDRELPENAREAADVWMRRVTDDPDTLILNLEFALHAARDPELRERYAHRAAALRLMIERALERRAEEEGIDLPLPAAELALVFRALGIGLGVERLHDPNLGRDELFGEFVALVLELITKSSREST
jgi:AcrR family transcriptional regulator